ncbi:host specificity factor TipJ family phage tail protein [Stenotrophomonas sp. CFBP 13718]|uniref:host specificity factor TipJ family phage tail protein n=1 Tax=Stenotrophomonas sp. CFBP 13718 TaxID=2775304 RepID=UPI00178629FC|nr:host specificity factor TipJ family phage tail protein [Stenotrophomonas sp. CFBP 13718]MBD8696608.1 carbohydrate-binding protein [Stenotrophomonas sp. CFBP 13718]
MDNPAAGGRLIVTPHPVLVDGQRNQPADLLPGESLCTFLHRHVIDLDAQDWVVLIGGKAVPRDMWPYVYPKHGQVIEARGAVGRSAVALVATLALTYFTFGFGAATAGWWGAGAAAGAWGGAAAAGIYMAGSVLINRVLQPKQPKAGAAAPTTYSIAAGRNRARPYEPLGLLIGSMRIAPDLISTPYTWYEGDDQFLSMVLTPGLNVHSVEALYNGDALLSSYDGVRVWHNGFPGMPSQEIPLHTNPDVTDGGTLLDTGNDPKHQPGAWVQRTSSAGTIRLMVGVEFQIWDRTTKGKDKVNKEQIQIQYRPAGNAGWQSFGSFNVQGDNNKSQRASYAIDVAEGQYDVRVRVAGNNTDGSGAEASFVWTTLTSVQRDTATYAGISRIGIAMKANGQLNGAPDEIRCVAHSIPIPVWTGSEWVTQRTSNPGAWILAYARGIYAPNGDLVAGMEMPERQIDIEGLKAFMLHCAASGFTYDNWITDVRSHQQVLDALALAGFGQISWPRGRLSVGWAADEQPLSGVVNMATIKKGAFQVDYTLTNGADGIEYTYLDSTTWEAKTLRVPAPGITTMLNPAQVTGEGITSEAHAAMLARWHLAQSLYQYKAISYSTDIEHLSYSRMSMLALQHDLTQWGYGGRVRGATLVNGRVRLLLDEPVPAPAQGNAYVGVRIPGERVYRVLTVQPFAGASASLVVDWPSDAPLPGSSATNPAWDTLWIYDFKQTPGLRVRVTSIRPESELKGAAVEVVAESREFWHYVHTGEYIPSPNESLLQTRPVASDLKITERQVVQGDTEYTELQATFAVSGPVGDTVVLSDIDGNAALEEVARTVTRTATWRIPGAGTYPITVRPYSPDGNAGVAASVIYTTLGADAPPVPVDFFNVEQLSGGVRRYTWGFFSDTIQSANFAGVEIRYVPGSIPNPAWEQMTPLGDEGYHASAFEAILPEAGQWTFACRSRNTSGTLSTVARVMTVTLQPNLGQIIEDFEQSVAELVQLQLDLEQEKVDRFNEDTRVKQQAAADATAKANAARDAAIAHADALSAVIGDLVGAGEWAPATSYEVGAVVKHEDGLYRALRANIDAPPSSSPDDWQLVGQFASVGDALAAAIAMAHQNASDIEAEAARLDAILVRLPAGDGAVASVQDVEQVTARVEENENGLSALGQRLTSFTAQVVGDHAGDDDTGAGDPDSYAGQITVMTVAADATRAVSKRVDTVVADFGEFEASVTDTFEAYADDQRALAERVTEVQSELEGAVEIVANNLELMRTEVFDGEGGIRALSERLEAVRAEVNGVVAEAISGLDARVTVNEMGVAEVESRAYLRLIGIGPDGVPLIGGMTISNNGQIVQTRFQSDIFEIASPDGQDGIEFRDGFMRAWAGPTQAVFGAGFGAENDLMLFTGPNVGASQATKAMANLWADRAGSAYFGGTLSAGVLLNAVENTSTQTIGTSLLNGPFDTNGRNKNVVISFSRRHVRIKQDMGAAGFVAGAGENTVTINVYRQLTGHAETLWQSFTRGGGVDITNEFDGPDIAISTWSGSLTVNDSADGATQRAYRAEIVAFTSQDVTHQSGSFNSQTIRQSLTIASTEV